MFNTEELQQLMHFLNKCTLNGNESLAHAQLLIKIQKQIQKKQTPKKQRRSR